MKLIFTADTHFDSRFRYEDAAARNMELVACFSRIADHAKELGAAVLLGGDLFDSPYPSPAVEAAVRRVFETHADTRFYAVCGNHDPLGATAFYADPPENLHVFPDRIERVELDGAALYGVSMRDAFGGGDPWDGFRADGKAITLTHGAFAEGGCYRLDSATLSNTGAALHLAGHIHKTERRLLPGGGVALYAGCPFGRGFDECGKRGYYVIDTETMDPQYVYTDARVYAEYRADISDAGDLKQLYAKLADIRPAENETARIVLTGSTAAPLDFDADELAKSLDGVVAVRDESTVDTDIFAAREDNTLEGEFTRIMLDKLKNGPESEETVKEALKEGIIALRYGK